MNQSKKYSCVEAENAFTSEGGLLPEKPRSRSPFLEGAARSSSGAGFADGTALPKSDEWLLRRSIAFDGRYYRYNGYRYELLADAIAYVALTRARPSLLIRQIRGRYRVCSPGETALWIVLVQEDFRAAAGA